MFGLASRCVNVSNSGMSHEQRRHARIAMNVTVHARDLHGQGQLVFASADISLGGAFLTSDLLLEDGETLDIELRMPRSGSLLQAEARVVWVRRFPEPPEQPGMGIEFFALSDGDRERLNAELRETVP